MAIINGTPGNDMLVGTASDDEINGLEGNDTIDGRGGDDVIDGGAGEDEMTGGPGDDLFIVDNVLDVTLEEGGGGVDTVRSSVSYTLARNLNHLTLTGSDPINGTGNTQGNILIGNDSRNILNGGAGGGDRMHGLGGDDNYRVDHATDRVFELSGQGRDTIRSSVSYTLPGSVENLILVGPDAIDGTGNSSGNELSGNAADNVLNGAGGADVMRGGRGDDTYIVNHVDDRVGGEATGGGFDVIMSSVDYVIESGNVEKLVLTGSNPLDAMGNQTGDIIVGNSAANRLFGNRGNDVLEGGGGDDELRGGRGNDVLEGEGGADSFWMETPIDQEPNVDTIRDFTSADDTIMLARSVFTGITANGPLSASDFRVGTEAADGTDRIVYDPATGNIFYDRDGNSSEFMQILIARVDPGTALTHMDFVAY